MTVEWFNRVSNQLSSNVFSCNKSETQLRFIQIPQVPHSCHGINENTNRILYVISYSDYSDTLIFMRLNAI